MKTYFTDRIKSSWKTIQKNYAKAPLEFLLFFWFSVLVFVFSVLSIYVFPESFKLAIYPYTGWLAGFNYIFIVISTLAVFSAKRPISSLISFHKIFLLFLFVLAAFGVFEMYTYTGEFEGNPYLHHSPWRPVWTIAVPQFWILILLSPRVRNYLNRFHLPKEKGDRIHVES